MAIDIIVASYTLENGHTLYRRNFYEHDIEKIRTLAESSIIKNSSMNQLHNEKEYNNLTIISNKNLVVIKYVEAANSPLLSMNVGNYYIAEIINNKYYLLNHNIMDRKSSDTISVTRNAYGKLKRFEEYEIVGWMEENDFNNKEILLMPLFNINAEPYHMLNPISGETTRILSPDNKKLIISKIATHEQIEQNLKNKPGFVKLYQNTYNKLPLSEWITYDTYKPLTNASTQVRFLPPINYVEKYTLWRDQNDKIKQTGIDIHEQFSKQLNGQMIKSIYSFLDPIESDEIIEQRLNVNYTPVKRHTVDLNIGINDDFLLIN